MKFDQSIPFWPRALAPQSIARSFARPVLVGPAPLSGQPQTVVSDMGALRLRLGGVRLHDQGRLFAQFEALLFGRLAFGLPIYMRLWNWRRGPRARAGLPLFGPPDPILFSDKTKFSDGGSFEQGAGDCVVAIAAAARATTIFVDMQSAAIPEGGDWISIDDRAYFVAASWPVDGVANRHKLQIAPGLRYAASAGDVVEVADPFFRAVLSPADMQAAAALDLGIIGAIDLTFCEANWTA